LPLEVEDEGFGGALRGGFGVGVWMGESEERRRTVIWVPFAANHLYGCVFQPVWEQEEERNEMDPLQHVVRCSPDVEELRIEHRISPSKL
jgi:hypothetical protein